MNAQLSLLAVTMAFLATAAFGQSAKKDITIHGEVVDLQSYVTLGMKPDTPDRKGVAEASANLGNPLAIVQRGTGNVYVVTMSAGNASARETLLPYFGLKVFAVGKAYRRGGMRLFVLSDIGKSVK